MALIKNQLLSSPSILEVQNIDSSLILEKESVSTFSLDESIIKTIDDAFISTGTIKDETYSFDAKTFGVLTHIDTPAIYFMNAFEGINNLRREFDPAPTETKEAGLIKQIQDYFVSVDNAEVYPLSSSYFLGVRGLKATLFSASDLISIDDPDASGSTTDGPSRYYKALFSSGTAIRDDIRKLDRLRRALSSFHNYQVKQLARTKAELAELEAELPQHHRELSTLNRERREKQGDYQVVRLLVAEDWADVEAEYARRDGILRNHKGLYYARVRETPLNSRPVTDLPLRHGRLEDLVPGYPLTDAELPEELEPFIEAVLDVPVTDWVSLKPYIHLLPPRHNLTKMIGARTARLEYLTNLPLPQASSPLGLRLFSMQGFNQSLLRNLARTSVAYYPSLIAFQRASAKVLSLEDLLNGPPHRLRGLAQSQRNKIDQATHSLLSNLRNVSPSIRLDWATEAEADTLNVSAPTSWPGLGKAEAKDLNGIRTLVELVDWWWRQLSEGSNANSVSAVRNLLRAILMFSAADDPQQILHGQLRTIPGRFKLGDALRVSLNREALPGTQLQLVDINNVLVGTLRVDDFDEEGAVTTITEMFNDSVTPNSNFTVSGYALPATIR